MHNLLSISDQSRHDTFVINSFNVPNLFLLKISTRYYFK